MSGNIISPLHLQILPARLVLASVRKEHLADVMHAIVRIFIDVDHCDGMRSTFTPGQDETTNDVGPPFFSFTEF